MTSVSNKVFKRLLSGIKHFQPVLTEAKTKDKNEADTSLIVTDILSEIFGYDKYSEITSQHAIRNTYCDLAIKLNGELQFLIEIKAIGLELKDTYVKQAIDYAVNQGIDWVILTNATCWRVYKVLFKKPVDKELVAEFDISQLNMKSSSSHVDLLFMLSKEGWQKSRINDYHAKKRALDRFFISALVLSNPVLNMIRRELKKLSPNIKIELDQIKNVIESEVMKREVLENEKADEANKRIARLLNCSTKTKETKHKTPPHTQSSPLPKLIDIENTIPNEK
jgi:predicted type IV restriction endonuclease